MRRSTGWRKGVGHSMSCARSHAPCVSDSFYLLQISRFRWLGVKSYLKVYRIS